MLCVFYIGISFLVNTVVASPWFSNVVDEMNRGCIVAGQIICTDSCTKVSLCLGDGAGGFSASTLETCGGDQRCSAIDAACVQAELSECRSGGRGPAFQCRGAGFFPDPNNCSLYHLCSSVGDPDYVTGTCAGELAYNPRSHDCSLERWQRPCMESPVPACTQLGQAGRLPEDAGLYYVCSREGGQLVPSIYRCPPGTVWDLERFQCGEQL